MHNYDKVILDQIARGKLEIGPGTVYRIHCEHDRWCAINHEPSGECNCNVNVWVDVYSKDGKYTINTKK